MRLRNITGAKQAITDSPFVVQEPMDKKGKWEKVFPAKRPIHMEVGMGKGRFLMDMARLYPAKNYLGVEMYDSVLLRALQKRQEEELDNLLFLCVDARHLPDIFEKGEIDRIYLNFSDPWPKARHAKRRLTYRDFLKRYALILKKDGEIRFKTDNKDLFDFSIEEFTEVGWKLSDVTYDLHQAPAPGDVETEYEEKFSRKGNPVCRLVARRPKSN